MIPRDKALHFLTGQLLFAVGWRFYGIKLGLWLVLVAAIAKEIFDDLRGGAHAPDLRDAMATGLGGAWALLLLAIGGVR